MSDWLQSPLISNPSWSSVASSIPIIALLLAFAPADRIRRAGHPVMGWFALSAFSAALVVLIVHAWNVPRANDMLTWGEAILYAGIIVGIYALMALERACVRRRVTAELIVNARRPTGIRLMGVQTPAGWQRVYQAVLERGQATIDAQLRGDTATVWVTIDGQPAPGFARVLSNNRVAITKPLERGRMVFRAAADDDVTLEVDVGTDTVIVPIRTVTT